MTRTIDTDVLIVGAGPIGLYGAYCAGFRGLRATVVDALPQAGGQVAALYPEKQIHDVAGLPAIKGRDFVAALLDQGSTYGAEYVLGRQAVILNHTDGGPHVTLDDGTVVHARAVLLTGGIGTFTPRKLPVGDEWHDRGLRYFVTDPLAHADEDVIVVGGGDSALDWADTLRTVARSVTLVHRRSAFRGHRATLDRVLDSSVAVHTDTEVVALDGGERLAKATLRHRSGDQIVIPVDTVVAALGFLSDLGPLASWGFELRGRSVAVDRDQRTSVPHVWAAGDIADHDDKVRLISVGFGEVATAVNHLAVALDPTQSLFPGHSTDAS